MSEPRIAFFGNPDEYKELIDFLNRKSMRVSAISSFDNKIEVNPDIIIYDKSSQDYLKNIHSIKKNFPQTPLILLSNPLDHIRLSKIPQVDTIYFKPLKNFDGIYNIALEAAKNKKDITAPALKPGIKFSDYEKNYKQIFENVKEAIFITDEQGIIEYANPSAGEVYGYTAKEFLGMSCAQLITDPFHHVFKKYLDDVKTKGFFSGETIDIHKNGKKIYTQVRGSQIKIGGLTHLLAIIKNITTEKQLLAKLSRFNDIIENSSDMISISTSKKEVTYINQAGLDLLGWDSLTHKQIKDVHPEWALDIIENVGLPHALKHRVWVGETAVLTAKGETIPVSQLIMVHKSQENGQVEYLSTVIRNITDRIEAEKEREVLIKTLEQQNAEMERFVYTVSHDLKAPLVTITGFINLLMIETEDNQISIPDFSFADCALRIKNSAGKMSRLLDDLLNFSRAGRVVGELVNVNFYQIAQEAIDQTEINLKNKHVAIKLKHDLPDVKCDKDRIVEVMVNLIDNAVKFIGDTNEPEIEIGVTNENSKNIFFIRDNGIGIEPAYFDKIFELFERLDHATEGTGVGLAVVKRIIEYHDCSIWAESQGSGQGSVFYFTLPQAD